MLGQLMFPTDLQVSVPSFFFLFFFLCVSFWIIFITVSSNSLISSSALSNLPLIQSLIFHRTRCSIHLYKFNSGHLYLLGLGLTF